MIEEWIMFILGTACGILCTIRAMRVNPQEEVRLFEEKLISNSKQGKVFTIKSRFGNRYYKVFRVPKEKTSEKTAMGMTIRVLNCNSLVVRIDTEDK